jgi:methionyl-tRNA formyltransferase
VTTGAEPGTVVDVTREAIHAATGQEGRVAIERVQLEGGRPLTTREFLAGHPIVPGQRFTNH